MRYGLTSVHHEGGDLAAIQEVRARGELLHRVSYEASGGVLDFDDRRRHQDRLRRRLDQVRRHVRAHRRRLVLRADDGDERAVSRASIRRTRATSPRRRTTLNAWVERVHRAGIQVNCHANGDVAIDMYLTALERAQKLFPRAGRAAEDHALHADQRRPRPPHQGARRRAGDVHDLRLLQHRQVPVLRRGPDEALHGVSARCSTPGIHAAAGSDFSPGPFAPLMGIQGMVTRTGWDGTTWGANQRITRRRGHPDQHAERRLCVAAKKRIKGSITAGKLADFVVLADDPHTVEADKIKDIRSCARSWAATPCTKRRKWPLPIAYGLS